ncbi:MAG: UDP-N-acetylmuramate dehydrogenase [Deltaproteobacteria bacterium]|nr:UDP-N-acetylmuramate dehydrogenase [Deltaproteobacteria bacterium]
MKDLPEMLRAEGFSGPVHRGEPMSRHCSLKVGGKAALLAIPETPQDLRTLLGVLEGRDTGWMILGSGTNVFFPESGFGGCVIRLGRGFGGVEEIDETIMEAGASARTAGILAKTARMGLAGLEFAAGIPGTIGGAVRMNAGAGGGEMAGAVMGIQIVVDGRTSWIERKDLDFRYRRLALPGDAVITRVRIRLSPDSPEAVGIRMDEMLARKKARQPLGLPSAGCWFMNPEGDNAGRIIEAAGLKGLTVGGARVSDVHANFLVNVGGATAADFEALAGMVKAAVLKKFEVGLKEEVRVVY